MAEPMLNDDIRTQVEEILNSLHEPLQVLFFTDQAGECTYCADTQQLLQEVMNLSPKLELKVYEKNQHEAIISQYQVERFPTFIIGRVVKGEFVDYGIRFSGIPAGHEFTSLINDLLLVSKGDSGLNPETRKFLASLQQPVELQVFVTPTCPYCPRAVVLAHQFALESPMIRAEMIESMEFPALAEQFNVSGVPHTTINGTSGEVVGAVPEAQLLAEMQRIFQPAG